MKRKANDAYSGRTGPAGESNQRTIAQIKTDSVILELKKWEYKDGDSRENAVAEARAEAASPLGRIVPVSSLAHRRFRIEVLEPLLSYAKSNDSIRPRSKLKSPIACLPYRQKGRLAWAVQNFCDSSSISESRPVLVALDSALSTAGVGQGTHLRKWLHHLLSATEFALCIIKLHLFRVLILHCGHP